MRTCRTAPVASSANISVDRKRFRPFGDHTRSVIAKRKAMAHSQIVKRPGNRNAPLPVLEQNKSRHAVKRGGFAGYRDPVWR
jgi:hypothetical protein